MGREDAEHVLQARSNGTFLVRQSVARRGELALSVKSVSSPQSAPKHSFVTGNESVPKIIINNALIFFQKLQSAFW